MSVELSLLAVGQATSGLSRTVYNEQTWGHAAVSRRQRAIHWLQDLATHGCAAVHCVHAIHIQVQA